MTTPSSTSTGDVAIIGGGPAGLIAAEILGAASLAVTVYEHRRSVGRKFVLAGRGGLNITHSEELPRLLERYGTSNTALAPAITDFSPDDLRQWCADHGETTFVGTSGRVFPESFRATPLLRSLLGNLRALDVQLKTGHRWTGWTADGDLNFRVDGHDVAKSHSAIIFALGGPTWPRVGGDGGWIDAFEHEGIEVVPFAPANCGVNVDWSAVMRDRFGGHPIKNTIFSVGETSARGDAVITSSGLEGGPIYALGPQIRASLGQSATTELVLDTQPDLTVLQLTDRLSRRRAKSSATSWFHSAGLPDIVVALLREVTGNQLRRDAGSLAQLTKHLPIPVVAMASIDRAISCAGGVSLGAIDDQYMLVSRPGTFVAGEMLDWEAPTGGYLLQACLSTGVAAARGAMTWLDRQL